MRLTKWRSSRSSVFKPKSHQQVVGPGAVLVPAAMTQCRLTRRRDAWFDGAVRRAVQLLAAGAPAADECADSIEGSMCVHPHRFALLV
mmetsp:Transcript_24250/g.60209  ORF Transcript_24250/g.60209 Transcript_24250/m.60209 type:complete len:88 (+) Transcript_24250:71-334(+)